MIPVRMKKGELVALLEVTFDEADFIATLIEDHCPRDEAGPEWRAIADAVRLDYREDE